MPIPSSGTDMGSPPQGRVPYSTCGADQSYTAALSNPFFISFGAKTEPLIAIHDSAGRAVARVDEDSALKAATWRAEDMGKYYVVLGDGASSGDYTLTVQLEVPAPTATLEPAVVVAAVAPTPETIASLNATRRFLISLSLVGQGVPICEHFTGRSDYREQGGRRRLAFTRRRHPTPDGSTVETRVGKLLARPLQRCLSVA